MVTSDLKPARARGGAAGQTSLRRARVPRLHGPLAGAVILALLALLAAPPPAAPAAPHRLAIGFGDWVLASPDAATRELWLGRARNTGSTLVRVNVAWSRVAPQSPPPGFDPRDPASPGYRWEAIDAAVRGAVAHGLRVMLTVASAPVWAEGPGRPAAAAPGTWKPKAAAYGGFAAAIARRYSGSFPDPLRPGQALPRVRYFEAWNEPNLDTYLSPQWQGRRSTGPALYRALLNAFYAGVKSAQPGAKVLGGSLAPFGDRPGGARTPPVLFLRKLLCLREARLAPAPCPRPARFDILSDHPIAVGPPLQSALSPLDATGPDLGRLTRVLRKAERTGRVRPAGRKALWVTEFWYDSDPPDPDGVPLRRQARWYAQDLYLFWRQGATAAIALQLVDSPPGPGYQYTNQSGAFFLDGRPKPSQVAFRFPFVAQRRDPLQLLAWGIAPRPGRVRIEARRGGRWVTLASPRARGRARPFTATLRLRGHVLLRARQGAATSLTWRQR